ncbi:nucleoporin Nup37 isoform X1 [Copidosoma floridanum]|uniref:nucleoporin Nup37 isoform X1 n=1 Tax=Copidosoma floridanum TaxID=29053 RepID=UPI0006C98685|nr:nucleoporin Nup37 isoform X1 [Copidosoma floridanum]XP_014204872.1 nucleoporin Nup37 isoform X1 [Copidosoma floridanum]
MEETQIESPSFKLNFEMQIHCVEWSPYEWSEDLICIGLENKIIIASIKFQEEDNQLEDISYTQLKVFNPEGRVHAIAWSPETSLSVVPKLLSFSVASADFKIRLFNSNLIDESAVEILEGHKNYVNSIAYDGDGELLASVSDDLTCKLWAIKENRSCILSFVLTAPGVAVKWHNEEPGKLLVAEKLGIIRMYNVRSQQAIMSMDASKVPLMTADWSPNSLKVACLAAGELCLFDVSRPSRAQETKTLHLEGGTVMKFSPANENLIATIGRPDNNVKVVDIKAKEVQLCSRVRLYGGLTWHQRLQVICAGSDRKLLFWKVPNK